MSEIIDLGNGYGMVTHYFSPCANLHVRIDRQTILRLYSQNLLTKYQACYQLSVLGYAPKEVAWCLSLSEVKMKRDIVSFLSR